MRIVEEFKRAYEAGEISLIDTVYDHGFIKISIFKKDKTSYAVEGMEAFQINEYLDNVVRMGNK